MDFLLPRFCVSCDNKITIKDNVVCSNCLKKFELTNKNQIKKEFEKKFLNDKIISGFTSPFIFSETSILQKLIHELKYNQNYHIGKFLGELAANYSKEIIQKWNIDYIVPVPLHKIKKAERGYNQSQEISKGYSEVLNINILRKSIIRKRFTPSQTKLNLEERKLNIADAFAVKNKKRIINKNILLIDDVITTGATISECGKELLNNGAAKIFCTSIALAE